MNENIETDSTPTRSFGEDSVGYDPITGTFHARFETDPATLVVTIVETVATVTNCDPASLPPLFEAIDPEALSSLVTSTRNTSVDVAFSYEGCQVTVSSHGTVIVEPHE